MAMSEKCYSLGAVNFFLRLSVFIVCQHLLVHLLCAMTNDCCALVLFDFAHSMDLASMTK